MIFFSFLIFLPLFSWAHGENVPGPHMGHIQMPGAFHTELVWNGEKGVDIYLLDINFANSMTQNSSLHVSIKDENGSTPMDCTVVKDHFRCTAKGKIMARSQIILKASRDGAQGSDAIYQLPLKKFKMKGHSGHH